MACGDGMGGDYSRESEKEEVRRALDVVARMKRGQIAREAVPWGNHMLQEAIIRALRDMPALERDSEHLAIVKSVFSGAGAKPLPIL